jgi:hypothetical protein
LTTDNIGLTCETIGDCQTIIDIEAAIDALEEEILLKANTADISAVGFSNDYDDLDNKPTIPNAQVNSDWNATSGVAEILNKPTIPTATSDLTNDGEDGVNPFITAQDLPDTSGFVPYTGATQNVDLGTHTLSAKDLVINHSSGSGVAASITKGGAGEALTVNKTSGSGNAMSVTGGVTQLDELHLTTDLADAYIASAATWNAKVPETRTLTINGTTQDLSANRTFTIATGLTVGTTPITSGTVGRVLFEGTGNVLQESANFFWDNTNSRLGIGTATPAYQLSLAGSANIQGVTGLNFLVGTRGIFFGLTGSTEVSTYLATSPLIFSLNQGSTPVARFSATNGNLLIGTTTDAGYKLDVNGTARVSGALTVTTSSTGLTYRNTSAVVLADIGEQGQNSGLLRLFGGTAGKLSGSFYFDGPDNNNAAYAAFGVATSGTYFGTTGAVIFSSSKNGTGTQLPMVFGGYNASWTTWMQIRTNGNVLINTTTDVASSKLTIESTTQGFLPPRMTTTQKNAIASPAAGLVVYDTTLGKLCVRTASAWETITSL